MNMDEVNFGANDGAPRAERAYGRINRQAMPSPRQPRQRVFKPNATYICNREGLIINGEAYSVGDRISPRELSLARLRTMFDAGFIDPM